MKKSGNPDFFRKEKDMTINEQITAQLFTMQDLEYKSFHCKLIPNISTDRVIGVRTPQLRAFAKEIKDNSNIGLFLDTLPHKYYDENNLHSFIIANIKDFEDCILEINKFLPYVDNWATCDMLRPKCFKRHTKELLCEIKKWILSGHNYTIRFAIEMLMMFYLEEEFKPEFFDMVAAIDCDEYYVNMMIAWYFATALAKQYDEAVKYIEERRLPEWVHNKTIQKAVESYRVSKEQKEYLKTLKI